MLDAWLDCKFVFGGEKGEKNFEVDVETTSEEKREPRQLIKFSSQVSIQSKQPAKNGTIDEFSTQIEIFFANEMDMTHSEELLKICHIRLIPLN